MGSVGGPGGNPGGLDPTLLTFQRKNSVVATGKRTERERLNIVFVERGFEENRCFNAISGRRETSKKAYSVQSS